MHHFVCLGFQRQQQALFAAGSKNICSPPANCKLSSALLRCWGPCATHQIPVHDTYIRAAAASAYIGLVIVRVRDTLGRRYDVELIPKHSPSLPKHPRSMHKAFSKPSQASPSLPKPQASPERPSVDRTSLPKPPQASPKHSPSLPKPPRSIPKHSPSLPEAFPQAELRPGVCACVCVCGCVRVCVCVCVCFPLWVSLGPLHT